MADVTVKRIEHMEAAFEGVMVRARASLGVTAFGLQVLNLPSDSTDYPDHDETATGQEEVYVVLEGSGRLSAGGADHVLEPGVFARVGSKEKRKILPGKRGLRLLVIGGVPGGVYKPAPWTELDAPTPAPGQA